MCESKLNQFEMYKSFQALMEEMEDALSFMEMFENDDSETAERVQDKRKAIIEGSEALERLKELLVENMHEDTSDDTYRQCTTCGNLMTEGFCIESGVAYYCNEKCMEKDGMKYSEFLELYDDGEGDSYWTQWEG